MLPTYSNSFPTFLDFSPISLNPPSAPNSPQAKWSNPGGSAILFPGGERGMVCQALREMGVDIYMESNVKLLPGQVDGARERLRKLLEV